MNLKPEQRLISVKNIFNRIRSFLESRKALQAQTIDHTIFTVLDTETTGLNVNEGHKIVSVGAIKTKGNNPICSESFAYSLLLRLKILV